MKRHFFVLMLLLVARGAAAETIRLSLAEAIKNRVVSVHAVSNGGFQGKTTRVVMTNNKSQTVAIRIDIGTILKADSGGYQPMVLAGEELLVLQPSKTGEVLTETFCGNSPASCPSAGTSFAYAGIGSDTLVTVLRFIKANSLFDDLGQSAVWAVTNNKSLSNIYDNNRPELARRLLDVICKATGRPMPDYYTINRPAEQIPNAPAYVPKPLKIIASFRVALELPKILTLGVFNEKGEMIQKVFEDQSFPRSGHEFGVQFEAADVAPGKYFIRLKEGSVTMQEKAVVVE